MTRTSPHTPDRVAWPRCEARTYFDQRCQLKAFWQVAIADHEPQWLCGVHIPRTDAAVTAVARADGRDLEASFV